MQHSVVAAGTNDGVPGSIARDNSLFGARRHEWVNAAASAGRNEAGDERDVRDAVNGWVDADADGRAADVIASVDARYFHMLGLRPAAGRLLRWSDETLGNARMTMGAARADVIRLFLREAATVVVVGLLAGIAAAFAGSTYVQSLVFGVSRRYRASVLTAVACMLAVAALATCVPAHRAASVPPADALRAE